MSSRTMPLSHTIAVTPGLVLILVSLVGFATNAAVDSDVFGLPVWLYLLIGAVGFLALLCGPVLVVWVQSVQYRSWLRKDAITDSTLPRAARDLLARITDDATAGRVSLVRSGATQGRDYTIAEVSVTRERKRYNYRTKTTATEPTEASALAVHVALESASPRTEITVSRRPLVMPTNVTSTRQQASPGGDNLHAPFGQFDDTAPPPQPTRARNRYDITVEPADSPVITARLKEILMAHQGEATVSVEGRHLLVFSTERNQDHQHRRIVQLAVSLAQSLETAAHE